MQVVILCGGLGTRLREETEFRPKPMVNIGNRPILWHIMKIFATHGFDEFILCLGYKGEMIKDFFWNYEILNSDFTIELGSPSRTKVHCAHNEKGWRVTLAETGNENLKGSRLKQVEKYITGDTFLMTYGDGVADIDLHDLIAFHESHGKLATVTGISPSARFGELKIDGERVVSFSEKPQGHGGGLVNGGFMVMNRGLFEYLTEDPSCDLEFGPLEKVARDGQLMVYRHAGFWACMDTLRDTDFLNDLWNRNAAPWMLW